MGVPADEIN